MKLHHILSLAVLVSLLAGSNTCHPEDPCISGSAGPLPRCDGDIVKACTGGSYYYEIDCGDDSCAENSDGQPLCFRAAECELTDDKTLLCSDDLRNVVRCVELADGRVGFEILDWCTETDCLPAGSEFDQPQARCAF